MASLFGRPRPPAPLRARFGPEERLLAIADDGAATVAATQLGLWLPDGPIGDPAGGAVAWRRLDWHLIVKATWTEHGLELIEGVVGADGVVRDLEPVRYRLSEPRNLPAVVRQRVEHSIGRWEQVQVPGGTGRIVGRRVPGVDGVSWTARLDSGTPESEQARAVLVAYLDRVRALPPEALAEF
jgi:hypothetical protein